MSDTDKKQLFAELLAANPAEPLKAALQVFADPDDFPKAAEAASLWPKDPEVIAHRERITEEAGGELGLLPSKAVYARKVWAYATEVGFPAQERRHFMRLFGEIMEYLPTAGARKDDGGTMPDEVKITRRIVDANNGDA